MIGRIYAGWKALKRLGFDERNRTQGLAACLVPVVKAHREPRILPS
jgi:hypothetical protein